MRLLWLDDCRDPEKDDWLVFSPISRTEISHVIWVKSYDEFVKHIELEGLPDAICFDHDLADEHYAPEMYCSKEAYDRVSKNFRERTGLDCAKWLCDYCIDQHKALPPFNIHSANPVGAENIRCYLNNFRDHQRTIL